MVKGVAMHKEQNCWARVTVFFALIIPAFVTAQSGEQKVDSLKAWKESAPERDEKIVRSRLAALGKKLRAGDTVAIESLMDIATGYQRTKLERIGALGLACGISNADSTDLIAHSLASAWKDSKRLTTSDERAKRIEGWELKKFVQYAIKRHCDSLQDSVDSGEINRLVVAMGLDLNDPSCDCRYELIRKQDVSQQVLRDQILTMIRSAPNEFAPLEFLEVLSRDDVVGVRSLVLENPESADRHWTAIRVLSHFGDSSILPQLRDWRGSENNRTQIGWLERSIWQIEIQNPPSDLLKCLAHPEAQQYESPNWFISRASDLLPSEDVTRAIREYLLRIGKGKILDGYTRETIETCMRLGIDIDSTLKEAGITWVNEE